MLQEEWAHRPESLGFACASYPQALPLVLAGRGHRLAVRNTGRMVCVAWSPQLSLRAVVALVLAGTRVLACVEDLEDMDHGLQRLAAFAPAHLAQMDIALFRQEVWQTCRLPVDARLSEPV